MWQSATVAAVALAQVHLLFGGLGGVIAVIVGGVVSAIAVRNARRKVAAPATNPQPAPPSRRREPPVSYGEPAPPTSPSRRLHPGPISLRPAHEPPAEPTPDGPHGPDGAHKPAADAPATTLFNPDLFGAAGVAPTADDTRASLPLLRSSLTLDDEWSAQVAPPQIASGPVHAPLWSRTPFAPPAIETLSAFTLAPSAHTAPIWTLRAEAFVREEAESASASVRLSELPLWGSRLRAAGLSASMVEGLEGVRDRKGAPESELETPAPLWPSSLRSPAADAEEE